MSIAKTVKQYLDNKHIVYSVLELQHFDSPLQAAMQAEVTPRALYYPVILRDSFGLMMAVLPASHRLDYERLGAMLHRRVQPAFETQLSNVFADCQPGLIPPIGEPYGIRTIIDANLATPEAVYIVTGDRNRLIKLARKDFLLLQANAWLGADFTRPMEMPSTISFEQEEQSAAVNYNDTSYYIRERIEQITELPPMPEMATRVLKLRADPAADVDDLVKVIELDPSLVAQVLRYANSPLFGYRGQVDSLKVAIARVLGFDMVMNLVLGVSLARPFKVPKYGPLGLESIWSHSIYGATLMQAIAKIMPAEQRVRPGVSYLGGMLHDFGYLALGNLFRQEFLGLNDMVLAHPDTPIEKLEQQYLGIDHAELGAWLLKAWNLPDELVTMVREHHNAAYAGPHMDYVRIGQVADHVLYQHHLGHKPSVEITPQFLATLGLTEQKLAVVVGQVMDQGDMFKDIASRLAA